MLTSSDIPTEDLDRIQFLIGSILSAALYVRYNWSSLPDRLYYTALLSNYLDALAGRVPSDLLESVRSSVDPYAGFSVQREVETVQAYQDWADTYDQAKNPLIALEEPHVRQLLGDLQGKWVADIACGTGRYSRYAVQQGAAAAHGIDLSDGMLRVAQGHAAQLPNLSVAQGKTDALPLASGRYDVAVCALALEHVADLTITLHEIARLLKPGGILVISDFHPALIMVGTRSGIRNYMHRVQDYMMPMIEAGLQVTVVCEPTVGELPAEFPRSNTSFTKLLAHMPFVLIIKAQKP